MSASSYIGKADLGVKHWEDVTEPRTWLASFKSIPACCVQILRGKANDLMSVARAVTNALTRPGYLKHELGLWQPRRASLKLTKQLKLDEQFACTTNGRQVLR